MSQDEERDATYQQQTLELPEWTVMIYLAGDNNLSAHSIDILRELEAACPPSEQVRVLACFDANTPRPRGARYLEINHRWKSNSNPLGKWRLHNDLVPFKEIEGHPVATQDFCKPSQTVPQPTLTGAKEGLSRFLKFALKNHRAKRYMLILFGHGSAVAGKTFLVDNNPPSFLRLREFAGVLATHFDDCYDTSNTASTPNKPKKPKLDILACDNCMMNGIETAYQIRRHVDYIIGSQGLMLAVGWPFQKIIEEVVKHQTKDTEYVAERVLSVCARSLIDFSLMDRSSEQALCDLTTLRKNKSLVSAVKRLVAAMEEGLEFDDCGELCYPEIRDAIKLARLEAQSYFSETFVDLYDFCMLLLDRCNDAIAQPVAMLMQVQNRLMHLMPNLKLNALMRREDDDERALSPVQVKELLLLSDVMQLFNKIACRCLDVLDEIRWFDPKKDKKKYRKFVRNSYYVGSELQYSNGVSVYFPWTLPEGPIIFEPADARPGDGAGGSYGLSWASFDRAKKQPEDYIFKTAFDEYKEYDFAKCDGGNWASFLEAFFRATLRKVRRFDLKYGESKKDRDVRHGEGERNKVVFVPSEEIPEKFVAPRDADLQKSSSDTDSEDDCTCPTIKNYPRRFYLSPADCKIKCLLPDERDAEFDAREGEAEEDCVSYLGWNIRGLTAEVIELEKRRRISRASYAADYASEREPDGEPEKS